MSEQAVADEKDEKKEKEFPPLPKGDHVFTETVTVKWWHPDTKKFTMTWENVNALRFSSKAKNGERCFYLKQKDVKNKITPDSEITDADGTTYIVIEVPTAAEDVLVRVKKK